MMTTTNTVRMYGAREASTREGAERIAAMWSRETGELHHVVRIDGRIWAAATTTMAVRVGRSNGVSVEFV